MMEIVNEGALADDVAARRDYWHRFLDMDEADAAAIAELAPELGARVAGLVDAVYAQLSRFSATWRHFLPAGDARSPEELQLTDPAITERKAHLASYLRALVSAPQHPNMGAIMDGVGRIHTRRMGDREVEVPLLQQLALLAYVGDALSAALLDLPGPPEPRHRALRALHKLLWMQGDFMARAARIAERAAASAPAA